MEIKELKKLISLMNENGLVELEVSSEGHKVVLKKAGPVVAAAPMTYAPAPYSVGAAAAAPAAVPAAAPKAQGDDTVTFNSPMVGTFYRASSPKDAPLVKVGDKLTPDTVICLIEAMKVFNEIKAEMSGTVVEVLVENQEAVEFGQPLFLIKP